MSIPLIRRTAKLARLVAVVVMLTGCDDPRPRDAGSWRVEFANGLVTVEAVQAPSALLLTELAHRTGLRLSWRERPGSRVTVDLHRIPLPRAIPELLPEHSFVLRYVEPKAAGGLHVSELWVFNHNAVAVGDAAAIGDHRATRELTAALGDTDTEVRVEAVQGLAGIGGAEALHIVAQALGDADAEVRLAAIDALADSPSEAAARSLIQALNDEDPALRGEVVDALAQIAGEVAITGLEQALGDTSPMVREAAAQALSELN